MLNCTGNSYAVSRAWLWHLLRGLTGALALYLALAKVSPDYTWLAWLVALVAFRGCPACWLFQCFFIGNNNSCALPASNSAQDKAEQQAARQLPHEVSKQGKWR